MHNSLHLDHRSAKILISHAWKLIMYKPRRRLENVPRVGGPLTLYCITLFARACARSAFASNDISYLRGSSRCLRSDLSEPPPPPPPPVELNGIGDPIYCLSSYPLCHTDPSPPPPPDALLPPSRAFPQLDTCECHNPESRCGLIGGKAAPKLTCEIFPRIEPS